MVADLIEEIDTTNEHQQHTLHFLAEQLKLAFAAPKGRRYSLDMLICAFTLYHKSPSCYLQILKLLCLPSVRLLRALSANLTVGEGNASQQYLKGKAELLKSHEHLVNIQLDEIHIKSKVSYQNGKLVDNADNNDKQ